MESRTNVAVLDKAMAILYAYRPGEAALNPQTLATRTGLTLPTVYRLAQALAEHGLLDRDGSTYRLGVMLLQLGAQVTTHLDIRRLTLPHLRWLNEQTGENAELHVRRGCVRVPLEVVLSTQNLRPFVQVGEPMPLHVGASGKVLVAWMPKTETEGLRAASAERFATSAAPSPAALTRDLARIRKRGWGDSDGERSPGCAAVSAPVRDIHGDVVGAVVLSGPSSRLTKQRRVRCAPLVLRTAALASRDAGYVPDNSQAMGEQAG